MVGHTVLLRLLTAKQELAEAEVVMLLVMVAMVPLLAAAVVPALLSFVIHKHYKHQHQLREMYKFVMLQDIKYILGLLQVQLHFKLQ
jgi:hypothetical protein